MEPYSCLFSFCNQETIFQRPTLPVASRPELWSRDCARTSWREAAAELRGRQLPSSCKDHLVWIEIIETKRKPTNKDHLVWIEMITKIKPTCKKTNKDHLAWKGTIKPTRNQNKQNLRGCSWTARQATPIQLQKSPGRERNSNKKKTKHANRQTMIGAIKNNTPQNKQNLRGCSWTARQATPILLQKSPGM